VLVLGVIITRGGGILDRTVVGHVQLSGDWQGPSARGLAQLSQLGNGAPDLQRSEARGSCARMAVV
jgi:hypothetical protein